MLGYAWLTVGRNMAVDDLRGAIMDVLLRANGQALTSDEVVKGVAQRLEREIRNALKELADGGRIKRLIGSKEDLWRYQAKGRG
jgi:hypothetical protein